MQKKVLILLTLGFLASCSSYTSHGEKQYLNSRNGPKLQVPRPLTDENVNYFYNLPPQNQDARVSIVPPKIKGDLHDETKH